MKSYTTFLKMAVIGTALLAAPVFAQTSAYIRVDVPFPFQVGQQSLAAGTYVLKANAATPIMTILDDVNRTATMTLVAPSGSITGPEIAGVTFRVYGRTRFLSSVWIPGTSGLALSKSPAERELEKTYDPDMVAVLSLPGR